MSSAEIGTIETGTEQVDCSRCRTPMQITVMRRAVERDDQGELVWKTLRAPAICESCDRGEAQRNMELPDVEEAIDWLAGRGVNTRKHGHATIENFDATEAPRAPEEARRFVDDVTTAARHDRVLSLYLVSSQTGTGKSHLAVAIMRAVHERRRDVSVIYEPADRLVARVQDSYGKGNTDTLIDARARAGLYVLDDLGREKATADALRVLCTVLDEREGAPTVITSNDLPHELGRRYADESTWGRVASRLGDEVYRYVGVDGRDRRFTQKARAG